MIIAHMCVGNAKAIRKRSSNQCLRAANFWKAPNGKPRLRMNHERAGFNAAHHDQVARVASGSGLIRAAQGKWNMKLG